MRDDEFYNYISSLPGHTIRAENGYFIIDVTDIFDLRIAYHELKSIPDNVIFNSNNIILDFVDLISLGNNVTFNHIGERGDYNYMYFDYLTELGNNNVFNFPEVRFFEIYDLPINFQYGNNFRVLRLRNDSKEREELDFILPRLRILEEI